MTASNNYFPVYLDLADRRCLVVGGGEVAISRIESFLHAGAVVTIIAENADDKIQSWAEKGQVRWLRRKVRASDAILLHGVVGVYVVVQLNGFG